MNLSEEISLYADLMIDVEVELDRKPVKMRDILDFKPGSVLKMSRSAGDNIDILIGGSLAAFGEIVVVEDTVAVRITDWTVEN